VWITVQRLLDLPDLLHAELPDPRLATLVQPELPHGGIGQVAPAALGEHGRLGRDVGAGLEVAELLALSAAPLVAGAHPHHGSVLDYQLRRRGLGQQVGPGLLRLGLHIATKRRDRDHLVAVVAQWRRRRDADLRPAIGHEIDRLLLYLAKGEALSAPLIAAEVGEELLQRARPHHRPGEVVAAAGLRLLDDGDGDLAEALHRLGIVGEQLQQAVGAGEAGGAAADDRYADLDPLVLAVERPLDELLRDVYGWWEISRDDLAVRCHGRNHSR